MRQATLEEVCWSHLISGVKEDAMGRIDTVVNGKAPHGAAHLMHRMRRSPMATTVSQYTTIQMKGYLITGLHCCQQDTHRFIRIIAQECHIVTGKKW